MTELGTTWELERLADKTATRYRLTKYLKPIAYLADGSMRRISNALAASGDAAYPLGVDELAQFRLDTAIAGKSPLYYFGKGQSRVTMALLDANNVSGKVDGNRVTFPGAWNNADLILTMAGHRLQKDVVLHKGHPSMFQFRLDSQLGFDPETLQFGHDFRILQPVLEYPEKEAIPLKWGISMSGLKYILTCKLPDGDFDGWTLDPTLTLQPDGTDGVDALIRGGAYANTNYGTDVTLNVKNTGGLGGNYDFDRVSLVKWDLSSIPAGATISSVVQTLYWVSGYNGNPTISVYKCLRNWVESEATWNNYSTGNAWGAVGAKNTSTDYDGASLLTSHTLTGDPGANAALTFASSANFLAAATAAIGGTLNLVLHELAAVNYVFTTHSSDGATAGYRPKLVVEYTEASGVPRHAMYYRRRRIA